ncbi:RrF2 family transcriptional regulator [Brevibacterium litoralis]|uniref:RrF2 family transcriptional regulator n=1 Tax=Brevibacterium litoralis TaxID=3138935 RepID=UPI0032ECE11F
MKISARADYAVRAAVELASHPGEPAKAKELAEVQEVPHRFLEGILNDLRRTGIVTSRRGGNGGYQLAKEPEDVSVADVVRAVEGPLVFVRDSRPSELEYPGTAGPLLDVWVALRAAVRSVLDETSLADVVNEELPASVARLADSEGAWENP